jgi:hypothetical protein
MEHLRVHLAYAVLFALTSCATEVQVTGPHTAMLSATDVQQIKDAIQRHDLTKPAISSILSRGIAYQCRADAMTTISST